MNYNNTSNVSVYCRIRPRSTKADLQYGSDALDVNTNTNTVKLRSDNIPLKNNGNNNNNHTTPPPFPIPSVASTLTTTSFGPFDQIFLPTASQDDVFRTVGFPCITNVLDGYNATVFVYGQTGSGKTHTLEGDIYHHNQNSGLIPRLVHTLFHTMNHTEENIEFTVRCSYIEVYMERVYDLLFNTVTVPSSLRRTTSNRTSHYYPGNHPQNNNPPSLTIRHDVQRGIYVEGAVEKCVSSSAELMTLLRKGSNNRCKGMTGMNDQSSRSHTLVLLTIEAKDKQTGGVRISKLSLVDLAGSEQVSRTGAEGNTLEEAKIINRSLFTLSQCIAALANQAESNSSNGTSNDTNLSTGTGMNENGGNGNTPPTVHIPYRNSKLTRLLQDSLGGNARTSLIICLSPCSSNITETLSTLRFGTQAKKMKNIAIVNRRRTIEEMERLVARAHTAMEAQTHLINALQQRIQTIENSNNNVNGYEKIANAVEGNLLNGNEDKIITANPSKESCPAPTDKNSPLDGEATGEEEEEDAWGDANAWSMVSPIKSPQPSSRRIRTMMEHVIPLDNSPVRSKSNDTSYGSGLLSLLSPRSMQGILSELSLAKETTARAVAASAMDAEELVNLKEENRLLQQEIDNKEHTIHELMLQYEDEKLQLTRTLQTTVIQNLWETMHPYTCQHCHTQPYQSLHNVQTLPLLHESLCFDVSKYKSTIQNLEQQICTMQKEYSANQTTIPATNQPVPSEYNGLIQTYNELTTKYNTLNSTKEGLQKDIALRDERIHELETNVFQFTETMRQEKEIFQQEKERLIKDYERKLAVIGDNNTMVSAVDAEIPQRMDDEYQEEDDDDDNYTVCDEFMEIEKIIGQILQNRKYNCKSSTIPYSNTETVGKLTNPNTGKQYDQENNKGNYKHHYNSNIVKPVVKEIPILSSNRSSKETTSNRVLVTRTIYTHRGPTVVNTFVNNETKLNGGKNTI